jgi:membrane protease subunit HflC
MRAERETVAAQREADGRRRSQEILSNADRDSRVLVAQAKADAAALDAQSRVDASNIYAKSYGENRDLYVLLRSLDTLESVIGTNTRLVLRTDAAPFRVLVDGPGQGSGTLPVPRPPADSGSTAR